MRIRLLTAASLAVTASLAAPLLAQHQPDPLTAPVNGLRRVDAGWHALVNATVHTEPGEAIEGGSVLVRDGRIIEVADSAGWTPPAGARVWDCDGLHIYAGLIDAYVAVDTPKPDGDAPGAHWNPSVTPHRNALDGDGLDAKTAKTLRGMGFTTAAVSPKDGIFRGVGAIVSLSDPSVGDLGSDPDVRATVYDRHAFHALAFDTIPRQGGRSDPNRVSYPNSQMGSIALVRQTLSDTEYLKLSESDAPSCLRALDDDAPLLFDANNELKALRAGKVAKEFGRPFRLLGSGLEFRRLDAITMLQSPVIVPLNFPDTPKIDTIGERENVSLRLLMTWEHAALNPLYLSEAGVPVALTTARLKKKTDFTKNLRSSIEHGLDEATALRMLTTDAAWILGLEGHGQIGGGFVANLVVTDGPIFAKETEVRDVWIDGIRHEVTPAPKPEMTGTWEITTTPPMTERTWMEVTDGPKVVFKQEVGTDPAENAEAGEIGEDTDEAEADADASSKGVGVRLTHDGQFSASFDHEPFGEPGVYTVQGLLIGDSIRGTAVTSAGGRVPFVATRATMTASEDDAGDKASDETGAPDAPPPPTPPPSPPPPLPGYPFGPYASPTPPEQEAVVLANATIWTNGPDGIIDGAHMLVRDGEIVWVAETGRGIRIPTVEGARTIDCTGMHVTPGLIDCHSHTGLFQGGVNESGQAVTAEVRIGDITNPDAASWYRQLAGGITAANQLHGSANPIGGQSQTVKNRWGCLHPDDMHFEDAPAGIKFALGENVKQSNWGDRMTVRYPQTRMGVETMIRDRFTEARGYRARRESDAAVRRDLELETLAEILAGDRFIHCHSYRQDEILMLCRIAGDFGFTIGTFQHVLEGYKVAEAIKEHAIGASAFSDWWAYKVEVQDAIPHNGAIMHDVGVNVSFNSDSDDLARRMNVEAAKAVRYGGVSREDALKFVTLNPAIQLGIDDRVGSLEAKKDADFVIWSGDPLSSMSRPVSTWVDGRELFSLEQDAAHRETIAAERARIIQKILAKKAGAPKKPEMTDVASTGASDDNEKAPIHWMANKFRADVREYHLDLLRRGIDPDSAQCGQCGMCGGLIR